MSATGRTLSVVRLQRGSLFLGSRQLGEASFTSLKNRRPPAGCFALLVAQQLPGKYEKGLASILMGESMSSHRSPVERDILIGMGAGLVGMLAVGPLNSFLSRFISEEQWRRERAVREASPHDLAARKIAENVGGEKPGERTERLSRVGFGAAYGIVWGIVYAMLRRSAPRVSAYGGLPFGAGLFFLCDGVLAPLLRMSPPVTRLPWQINAKEMLNHVAWTAAAEFAHRAAGRVRRESEQRYGGET